MRIEDYFQHIRSAIDACPLIRSSRITYDKRSTYSGLIRGELYFPDDSVLFLREFVDVEIFEERLMYAYQYMDSRMRLVFRYDNTGHHKKLNVSSYPHHKHLGGGEVVAVIPFEVEILHFMKCPWMPASAGMTSKSTGHHVIPTKRFGDFLCQQDREVLWFHDGFRNLS